MVSKHHYPKIALSKQELSKLFKLLKKVLEDKLQLHLPKCGAVDPHRVEVENILNQHLAEILDDVKCSLLVDGIDLEEENMSIPSILALEPYVQVEPYDPELNIKLNDVLREIENQTISITSLRREIPLQTSDAYEQLVITADEEVKAALGEAEIPAMPPCSPLDAQVTTNYQEAIKNLSHVHDNLPVLENKIKSYNQVYDFLVSVYNQQNNEG